MHMRMLQVKVKQEDLASFIKLYEQRILPALESIGGCLYACLVQSIHRADDGISMTLWRSEEDTRRYEQSGLYKQLVAEARPFFADGSEWKLQLSKDFTLEYSQGAVEPTLKSFSVSKTGGERNLLIEQGPHTFLRIVSVHVKPDKFEEYKGLYESKIIPTLLAAHGCLFSCLSTPAGETHEAISVTMWNSRADAEEYERKGTFDNLLHSVQHTLSELTQLKMQSAGTSLPSVTSEDVEVDGFHLLVSRRFKS